MFRRRKDEHFNLHGTEFVQYGQLFDTIHESFSYSIGNSVY